MAEALAVVGVVASIVQLLDFGAAVLSRLKEFQSTLGEIPGSFRQISRELPLLLHTTRQIHEAIDTGSVGAEIEKALLPVIKGCQEQIELLQNIISKTLPKSDDSRLKKAKKAISSVGKGRKVECISKNLRGYVNTLTFYSAVPSTSQLLNDAKVTKIRQWLSPPDPSANHRKWCKRRQEDTGLWFLNSEIYIKWKMDAASIIWMYGIPGCGKTILSSTIIQDVFQHYIDDPRTVVAYFYFDFNDPQKQIPQLMVESLICQFLQKCIRTPEGLNTLFSSYEDRQRRPSLDSLLDVLQQMIQEHPQSYIVLDALDECKDRVELIGIIERMASWQSDKLHLLVTSREVRNIRNSLERLTEAQNIICLQSRLVDSDIQIYVRKRLLKDVSLRKWQKDSAVQQEIETALMSGPCRMFQWAVCQLDALGQCRNRLALRSSLASLPQTLDETYDRILYAINKDDSEYAVRLLSWLAFSSRPLLVEEVAEVIAVNTTRDPMFNQQEVLEDPLEVLDICSSLVTITSVDYTVDSRGFPIYGYRYPQRGKVVTLAHYSVKEYLISKWSRQSQAEKFSMQDTSCNDFLARSCLGYLLQFENSSSFGYKDVEDSKLARYAAAFWITHAEAVGERGAALNHQITEFFSKVDGAYLSWAKMYDPENTDLAPDFTRTQEDIQPPLYFASLFGWTNIVEGLISAGADVNAQGGRYNNALQAASYNGHEKVTEQLLRAGANVNAQGGKYGNPLQAASSRGHEKIIEQLLSAGSGRGGRYGNALRAASFNGHEKAVERLLRVDAQEEKRSNALWAASYCGHEKIVEQLLRAGADVDAWDGIYGSALQAASYHGHEKVVERLLREGANVDGQEGEYGSALRAASSHNYEKIVEQLLSAGANVNDVNGQQRSYGNALQVASYRGYGKVVEQLLNRGADVNAQGGIYSNALQAASYRGYEEVVKQLLSAGAIVNAQGGKYDTALNAAFYGENNEVFGALLNAGADDKLWISRWGQT